MVDIRKRYTEDGVNVAEGDSFSKFAGTLCRQSYQNSPYMEVVEDFGGHFRGPRPFRLKTEKIPVLNECFMDGGTDGVGTKSIIIAASMSITPITMFVTGVAHVLFAMVAGDITRWGGAPLLMYNLLDVSILGETGDAVNDGYRSMLRALANLVGEQRVILHKGETAEIGPCVGSENPDAMWKFNWGATMLGLFHRKLMITGDELAAGQVVVALREYGFRCNGISSVRKAFAKRFGKQWWADPLAIPHITRAATPSVVYDRMLAEANGWRDDGIDFEGRIPIRAICHVTGGAIESKFAQDQLFPRGLSAVLDNLYKPPTIMQTCAEWRGLSDEEAYATWNGGQGALVVVDEKDAARFIELAFRHDIGAKVCGVILELPGPQLKVHSKFYGKEIVYRPL